MRGGPAFAVSLVLSALEPALRAAAELGAWQIISPVNALGRVVVVGGLHEVQDKVRSPHSPITCRVSHMPVSMRIPSKRGRWQVAVVQTNSDFCSAKSVSYRECNVLQGLKRSRQKTFALNEDFSIL